MKPSLYHKNHIPFFYDKSESEFRQDRYERYDEMVVRQTALHYGDALWGHYPFQEILDWILVNISRKETIDLAEIGCGVGRLLGTLAVKNPTAKFWGIDYSYQMLRRTQELWINEKTLAIDCSNRGLGQLQLTGQHLKNLSLGLAKAEQLPFEDQSLDVVFSSFLLDRVDDPLKTLAEMRRIIRPDGQVLLVSPLNFQKASHWELFFPESRLMERLEQIGFLIKEQRDFLIREPLDGRGNVVEWRGVGLLMTAVEL